MLRRMRLSTFGAPNSVFKILGVVVGIVTVGLRKSHFVGAHKLSDLIPDLVENVSPATFVMRAKHLCFFLVHFQIRGENGLPRENPRPAPVPPLPYGTAAYSPIDDTDFDLRNAHEAAGEAMGWILREREDSLLRRHGSLESPCETGSAWFAAWWIWGRKQKKSGIYNNMEYRKLKDQDKDGEVVGGEEDIESLRGKAHSLSNVATLGGGTAWKRKSVVTIALTILTSSQAILIVWSKRAGKYEYSVTTANFMVETLKCALSIAALARIWRTEGVTEDNRLSTTLNEVIVYPIPAALYLVKNLLQYYIFAYVDAPGYQILKNLNIISTGVLYRIILKKKLSETQWAAFILLCAGCTTAQLKSNSDRVLQTPFQGWVMAIVMALLSGFAGVYTEAIIKKRPSRNINVQNFWLYVFGMIFNALAILVQDFDAVLNKGFFHGYSLITVLMIVNHALSGIAVSMVMKYADNIVKVYSTSVAMLLTAVVSVFLFGFNLSLAFFLGSTVVSVAVYLHSIGKMR
ncbi:CMP-sialic acid transporter 4 [Morella rubra]|uniref:CMP-sialic acid transporter 4 n=1 Tax=Morella rubra TaxID=262757 RepID=A0A6A1V8Y8_9ROSI|nr:CMP-sialic acid transporter 4 [Morella rubra]